MRYEVRFPLHDVNDPMAEVTEWFVADGDYVTVGDLLCEVSTSKAIIEIEAEHDGFLHIITLAGVQIEVQGVLAVIGSTKTEAFQNHIVADTEEKSQNVKITRKAEKLMQAHGLTPDDLQGIRGIIREKHVRERLGHTTVCPSLNMTSSSIGRGVGRLKTEFVDRLRQDDTFGRVSSEEKIRLYRENGAVIGDGVSMNSGAVIIANKLIIGNGTVIDENCFLEAECLELGINVRIGREANWFAHEIHIGNRTTAASNTRIDVAGGLCRESRLITGTDCLLSMETYINACREVRLGDRVCLSPRAMIFTHSYWHGPLQGGAARFSGVIIEDGAWIGAGAQVLPGVTLGEGATLISNSVADSHVKPMTNAAGIPAKQVAKRRESVTVRGSVYGAMARHLSLRLDYIGLQPELVSLGEQTHIHTGTADWIFHSKPVVEHIGQRTLVVSTASAPDDLPDTYTWFDLKLSVLKGVNDMFTVETQSTIRRFGVIFRCLGEEE